MNLSANVFLFGELQPHHQGWSTYSGGSDRPGSFSVSNGLTQMVNFPIRILDCDSQIPCGFLSLFSFQN